MKSDNVLRTEENKLMSLHCGQRNCVFRKHAAWELCFGMYYIILMPCSEEVCHEPVILSGYYMSHWVNLNCVMHENTYLIESFIWWYGCCKGLFKDSWFEIMQDKYDTLLCISDWTTMFMNYNLHSQFKSGIYMLVFGKCCVQVRYVKSFETI